VQVGGLADGSEVGGGVGREVGEGQGSGMRVGMGVTTGTSGAGVVVGVGGEERQVLPQISTIIALASAKE